MPAFFFQGWHRCKKPSPVKDAIMSNKNFYYRQWLYTRLHKWLVYPVCRTLYQDRNRDTRRSMIVAGTGRSGTTWVAKIISSQLACRVMFEPFHARYVPDFHPFHYFHYLQPDCEEPQLYAFCRRVLSGDIHHPWIDREVATLWPQVRLIKEIRANLFLKWINQHFPEVPILFVIRHPCAVVLSRMQLGWADDDDIAPFLAQNRLVADFLKDKIELVQDARTAAQKHALVWCISNLVPLQQFARQDWHVIFYENLIVQPEVEIPQLFQAVGQTYKQSVFTTLARPSSTVTVDSAVMHGHDKVSQWQKKLTTRQIDDILAIVAAFGLDYLYGENILPTPWQSD
jgi:hypothetical protein